MTHIIGMSVNSGAYQKLKAGYENADRFIDNSAAKKRVIQASTHGRGNMSTVGMGSSQVTQFSSTANISVELSSVKKDVLQMMKSLSAEVNIEIADEIRSRIRSSKAVCSASVSVLAASLACASAAASAFAVSASRLVNSSLNDARRSASMGPASCSVSSISLEHFGHWIFNSDMRSPWQFREC